METVTRQGTAPVGRLLLQYSLPAVGGFLANAIYQFVDRIMVGRGVGTEAMAAVTCVYPLTILTMGVGLLLGTGTGTKVSTYLGQGMKEAAEAVLGQSVRMAAVYGSILAAILIVFARPILLASGAEGDVLEMAIPFLRITAVGQVFLIGIISMGNILRVQGRPGLGLAFMGTGNVVNALLVFIAIYVLGWGVTGVAWATTLSVALNAVGFVAFVQSRHSILHIHRRHLAPDPQIARSILKFGAPILLMQVLGMFVFQAANHGAANLGGARGVAMVGVINSVTMLLVFPMLGVAQAMQPLVSFNRGAGNIERVRSILGLTLISTMGMGACFAALVLMVPGPVAALFSATDMELIALVKDGLPWFMVSVALFGVQGTASHYFLSIQQPGKAGLLLMGRQILAIPLFLVLPRIWGYDGLYLVAMLSDAPFALVAAWMLRKEWQTLSTIPTPDQDSDDEDEDGLALTA
ncbi:MAG TPA: MATE family efflux transporter [Fibrobacteria bacterium]|nr:MATE family efflux transporter [Fibrobacteria bacterium]HOX50200.1 MATE family efflux transporter [Fibrobacteria bacterium]